jgi:hypothetical protein
MGCIEMVIEIETSFQRQMKEREQMRDNAMSLERASSDLLEILERNHPNLKNQPWKRNNGFAGYTFLKFHKEHNDEYDSGMGILFALPNEILVKSMRMFIYKFDKCTGMMESTGIWEYNLIKDKDNRIIPNDRHLQLDMYERLMQETGSLGYRLSGKYREEMDRRYKPIDDFFKRG